LFSFDFLDTIFFTVNSDEELIKGVIRQEKAWLRKFHERFEDYLYNYISQKVERPEDVEEILQDIFVSAIYSLPSFSGKSSLKSWLTSIARHEIADFYRKQKIKRILFSHLPILETIADQALSPEMAMEEREIKEKMIGCFLSLSEGYRQVLRLKYIEGYTAKKIALLTGKSVKAVESRLRRARHAFLKNWQSQKINKKAWATLDQRELSLLAQSFGIDLSPLSHS
jgi:RNA polymerase sigma-70 factor (ECF subfamily)